MANAQTEYVFSPPYTGELDGAYSQDHSGARDVSGPHDLDGDGLMEVLVSDYSGGGRVHVIENVSADVWEWVYSTPVLDDTPSTENIRAIAGGDMDGDGLGEIVFLSGRLFADADAVGIYVFEHTGGDNDYGVEPAVIFDMGENQPDRWRAEQMDMVDVDGDGLDELLWANDGTASAFDAWYVNGVLGDIGSAFEVLTFEAMYTSRALGGDPVNRGGGSAYGIQAADLNGDGMMDIAMQSYNYYNFTNATVTGVDTYAAPDTAAQNVFLQATNPDDQVAFFGCQAVDIDMNGDDEVFCPNLQTGRLSVLNYEEGEDILQVTTDNVALDIVSGFSSLGITAGDVDGDGLPELIGSGPSFAPTAFDNGQSAQWIRIVDYIGPTGDNAVPNEVENPANYSLRLPDVAMPSDTLGFDIIRRDSAGVMTVYHEDGVQGSEFVAKLAFLGDADGDGQAELAVSMQGVDDSLFVWDEVWDADAGDYVRTRGPECVGKIEGTMCLVNENRIFLRIFSGAAVGVSITEDRIVVPSDYKLSANYPNPFNPSTSFDFTLPIDKQVSVKIYDVGGRLVRTLVNGELRTAGTYTVTWDGQDSNGVAVASGNYLYTLEYGNFRQSRTMVLVK